MAVKQGANATAQVNRNEASFAEAEAWRDVRSGWQPLCPRFNSSGFSFEWHDFEPAQAFNWSRSFHPQSVELCLNLSGQANITDEQGTTELQDRTLAFYYQGLPELNASRKAGERHQFITVEFSSAFLVRHFRDLVDHLHPLVRSVVREEAKGSQVVPSMRLSTSLVHIVESLRRPPVCITAQTIWFQGKAMELAAQLFFCSQSGEGSCTRTQRAARERIERACVLLRENLAEPPSLEELGRTLGCSPFYLSRLFSQETGMTMQQFIRQIRMERAAELLRTGKCNVTEAAFEVGYNSLSHFSAAFHATFGCCPGLFPLKTTSQNVRGDNSKTGE